MFSYSSKLVTQGSMTTSAHHTATSWICQLFVGCVAKHMPSEPSHNTLLATPVMFDRRASTSSHRSSGTLRTRFRYPLFFAHISLRLSRGRATAEQQAIGSLFSDLDNLITLHQRKHDQLVTLKKSLLEKMFV